MKTPNTEPKTSTDWRAQQRRHQQDLAELQGKIDTEKQRRQAFAVKSATGDVNAETDFNASFEKETGFRRDFERLEALIAHAGQQADAAEASEREAVEKLRRAALEVSNADLRARAVRIDVLFNQLHGEVDGLTKACQEHRGLGGAFPRSTKDFFSSCAMAAGGRNWLHLFTQQKPRYAVDQVASFINGNRTDDAEEDAA